MGKEKPIWRLAFFSRLEERKGIKLFVDAVSSLNVTDEKFEVGAPRRQWPVLATLVHAAASSTRLRSSQGLCSCAASGQMQRQHILRCLGAADWIL